MKNILLLKMSVFLCIFANCTIFYPPRIPIKFLEDKNNNNKPAEILMVFLHGRGDSASDYIEQGFFKLVRDSGLDADLVSVDSHIGYYVSRTLIDRLYNDIIIPAQKRGYTNIWLVGISMGGLGCLLYSQMHPETIQGLLVMAPFLGDKDVIQEIENSGGITTWLPGGQIDEDDYQRNLWLWLKQYTQSQKNLPELHIGFGSEDKFVRSNKILIKILPEKQVYITPGTHDWPPWKEIFKRFISSGALKRN